MANRSSTDISWATDPNAFVVDPDTDEDHPSGLGGPGKFQRGWTVSTEPQQWENYIIKLREDRHKAVMQSGRVPWDEDVYYKLGALAYDAGVLYVSKSENNKNRSPATQPTYWSPVKFLTAADYLSTVASMQAQHAAHTIPGQNSHSDNIVAIGGSYKATIDAQVKFVSDGTTAHTIRTDNPHSDTAVGVGTLPTTGGQFAGRVNYLDNLSLGTSCELMTNISMFVSFRSNAGAIGLGIADYHDGGRWQHIFTWESFPEINQLYNPSFKLPPPDLYFPLMSDLSSDLFTSGTLTFSRASTLAYTDRSGIAVVAPVNTPAHEVLGLKLVVGTSIVVSGMELFGARDGCISYTLNGVVVVKDVQFTNAELTSYFGTSGNVKNFRVWSQRLSPRQKLSIPR